MGLTKNEIADKIEELENAKYSLEEAIELIYGAVKGTHLQARARAYIIPHLESWLEEHHCSIDSLIEELESDLNDIEEEANETNI